jgi:hypothetical protein
MLDADYLAERAQQEMRAAAQASDWRVRQIHFELADAYAFRLREIKREAAVAVVREAETAA